MRVQRGNQRYGGLRPRVFRGAEEAPARDTRTTVTHGGQQGEVTCTECGACVPLKKAATGEFGRAYGIRQGDLITSPHRPGGGRYSVRRGDVLCLGSRRLV